jgi:hypothetical protein
MTSKATLLALEIIFEVVDLHLLVNYICPRDGGFEIKTHKLSKAIS